MKKRETGIIFLTFLLFFIHSFAQQEPQSHNPAREGDFRGKDLMKEWPENGPDLIWYFKDLGNGYSSPAVTSDRLFVTGEIDGKGYLFSLDHTGNLLWKKPYGEEWMVSFSGPRSTPVVSGDQVYILSGIGEIFCFNNLDGTLSWSLDMLENFHGSTVFYGFSESLLIDGDTLYCLPGGADTNVVALNRKNGEILWISKGTGETAGYVSPVVAHLPTRDLLIGMTEYSIYGLDKISGKLLWTYDLETELDLTCNYPVFDGEDLYYATGPGNGTVKLDLSANGDAVRKIWKNQALDPYFGGFVKWGDYLYGSSERQRKLISLDTRTGEISHTLDFFKGAVVLSGDMIYAYNEKGEVGLISIENGSMKLTSVFRPGMGTRESFAFPVIHNGVLYIRHGDALMAYDLHEK